jgi:hypothetical protein
VSNSLYSPLSCPLPKRPPTSTSAAIISVPSHGTRLVQPSLVCVTGIEC